jgi:hypothetical protein
MAAGLGFKDFTTGEVLTAADVDGYLMQGIWVFASAAARDSAVTSPQEGNACYLKDTNQVLTYSGSAWVAVGGGSPLTTKGDVYGFSTVDARIPIGANDTVLTADSTQALGLKWAAPAAGGGMTLLTTHTLSGSTSTISSIAGTYKSLFGVIIGVTASGTSANLQINPNASSTITNAVFQEETTNYAYTTWYLNVNNCKVSGGLNCWSFTINNYASTTNHKPIQMSGQFVQTDDSLNAIIAAGGIRTNSAITSLDFVNTGGTFSAGTVLLYGVN